MQKTGHAPVWETVCLTCVLVLVNRSRVFPNESSLAIEDALMCVGYFLAPLSFFSLAISGSMQIRKKLWIRVLVILFIVMTGCSFLIEGLFLTRSQPGTAIFVMIQAIRIVGLTAGVVLSFEMFSKYSVDRVIRPFLILGLSWAFLCAVLAAFEESSFGYILKLLLFIIACVACISCPRASDENVEMGGDTSSFGKKICDSLRAIATSVLFIGAIGFASGVVRILAMGELSSLHFSMTLCLGSIVGVTGFYIIYLKHGYPIRFTSAYRGLLFIIGIAFCLIPVLLSSYPVVLQMIIDAAYLFAGIVMWLSCLVFSKEKSLPVSTVCGFMVGGVYLFVALGATTCTVVLSNTNGLFSGNTGIIFLLIYGIACVAIVCGYLRPRYMEESFIVPKKEVEGVQIFTPVSEEAVRGSAMLCDAYGVTPREMDVLVLILSGRGISHIAKRLAISENTVKTHVKRIYRKLGVHSRDELCNLLNEIIQNDSPL